MPLPNLPVEIWRQILTMIVRIPGLLSLDKQDPFEHSPEVEFHTDQLSHRVALLLVCKDWHEVVTRLMHEHIIVTTEQQLSYIVEQLQSRRTVFERCPLGLCTRRIDLQLQSPDARVKKLIVRLLRCTPNLEIFINGNLHIDIHSGSRLTHCGSEVIKTLSTISAPTLRRVEWIYNDCPSWSDLMLLLRSTPNLRSLAIANIHGSSTENFRPEMLSLPHLRTLEIGNTPSFSHASIGNAPLNALLSTLSISPDQLPSLQRLEGFSPFSPDFLRAHGPKIRIVRTVAQTPLLPQIIAQCPNLDTFIAVFPHQLTVPLSHPTLRRIGIFPVTENPIEVPPQIFDSYVMSPLCDLLDQIDKSVLPKLTHLRIRNAGTLADVTNYPVSLQKWWRRWNIKGVRFEDKNGRPFQVVESDEDTLLDALRGD
ncbi:hypothetical protein BV22DRAFT_1199082 [Leucogyrophana mollusca]|uniref:Uncharacterized protein n=1 Tax=Leucogyrophana mollusca TaxID=85980 RepID=A0ACB8B430_9AGAM|nr:hypothetical protein BV22DRAFT_1199082 [Leucogyrophana mollusca]